MSSSYFHLRHYCLSLWFHWARLWYLPCVPLLCSILHTASYPTGSVSEVGRHAYLMMFTCSDSLFCFVFCFYCGWVAYIVISLYLLLSVLIVIVNIYIIVNIYFILCCAIIFLQIDRVHCAVPLSDFLSGSICSVQNHSGVNFRPWKQESYNLGNASTVLRLTLIAFGFESVLDLWNRTSVMFGSVAGYCSLGLGRAQAEKCDQSCSLARTNKISMLMIIFHLH